MDKKMLGNQKNGEFLLRKIWTTTYTLDEDDVTLMANALSSNSYSTLSCHLN